MYYLFKNELIDYWLLVDFSHLYNVKPSNYVFLQSTYKVNI
jgi:hypothetical protein